MTKAKVKIETPENPVEKQETEKAVESKI